MAIREGTGLVGVTGIKVVMDPLQRQSYLGQLLNMEGLNHIEEDPKAAYCPISLTGVPEEVKPYLMNRQEQLMQTLADAGIKAYDPATAPFSPDVGLIFGPERIYAEDSAKIAGARFFTGHHILPSFGVGVEAEKATKLNRIAVMLMDRQIRVSRMQPARTICLEYDNFADQRDELVEVFQMLQEYEPGLGFHDRVPVLLGFNNHGRVVDLQQQVYHDFPNLKYNFDGTIETARLQVLNPEIFYEKNTD